MLREILSRKLVDCIAMDVKTSLEEYTGLVGGGVDPGRITESIQLIRDSRVEYEFRMTLIKEHHTNEVLESMQRLLSGATRLSFQRFRPEQTLSPLFAAFHPFSDVEMADIAKRFRFPGRQVGVRG
jgi:pyruvate formate lyase activating enzyme